jgi:hypothetical protein
MKPCHTLTQMGTVINIGILFEDFEQHKPGVWGSTKLIDFAKEFAAAYKSQG